MVRGTYHPTPIAWEPPAAEGGPVEEFLHQVRAVSATGDELFGRYYALAYRCSGAKYVAAGRFLDVDPRVVRNHLESSYLERLRGESLPARR